MTDAEVQVEIQHENSPPGQHAFGDLLQGNMSADESDCSESLQNSGQRDAEDPLVMLAGAPLTPPGGEPVLCNCIEVRRMERNVESIQQQLRFLISQADDLHDCLVNRHGHRDRDAFAVAVPNLLFICQPFFYNLESTARSTVTQRRYLPDDVCTRLLGFSQQLCDRLEQLLLTYASYNLVHLDEFVPNSVSHFCIGQYQLGQLRLTTFRYSKPTPYLARADTGLYKRMRWNVETLNDEQLQDRHEAQPGESEGKKADTVGDPDYYFLCYEDIHSAHAEADMDSQGDAHDNVVRMWSIGQWVQVTPDPNREDIYDWIMCEVPRGSYRRLLFLGNDEPSSRSATDYLQQLLLSHQTND